MSRHESHGDDQRKRPERPTIEVKVRDLDRIREKTPVYLEPLHLALGAASVIVLAAAVFAGGYFLGRSGGNDTTRPSDLMPAASATGPAPSPQRKDGPPNGATRGQVLPPPSEIVARPGDAPLATGRRGQDTPQSPPATEPAPAPETIAATAATTEPELCAPTAPCADAAPSPQAPAPAPTAAPAPPAVAVTSPAAPPAVAVTSPATPPAVAVTSPATPPAVAVTSTAAPSAPGPAASAAPPSGDLASPGATPAAAPTSPAAPSSAASLAAPPPVAPPPPSPPPALDGDGFWPGVLFTDLEGCMSCIVADGACRPLPPVAAVAPVAAAPVATAPIAAPPVAVAPANAPDPSPMPKAPAPPEAAAKAPARPATAWAVQARAFRDEAGAKEYVTALKSRGYSARVVSFKDPSGTTWFRVRLGRFQSLVAAQGFASKFNLREHETAIAVEVP